MPPDGFFSRNPLIGLSSPKGCSSSIFVWNVETDELVAALDGHADWVQHVVYVPAEDSEATADLGGYLYSASMDGKVRMWHPTRAVLERAKVITK